MSATALFDALAVDASHWAIGLAKSHVNPQRLRWFLLDQLIAVGLLLAAKSVLRFGDLREAQDRKLTEYVLLGTLLSVLATLILGMCVRQLLG